MLEPALPAANYPTQPEPSSLAPKNAPIIINAPAKPMETFTDTDEDETPLAMDEIEKEAIRRALKKYNGRRKEAAEELKISERTLYRKIKQYDL
jgi:transcriptional regulator with PAS, ATPase and Fis domain